MSVVPGKSSTPDSVRMLDRYELIGELGAGGMGAVYLARLGGAGGFQRLFAIKLMHPHFARQLGAVQMLLDEARLAAKLHHPNAVGILDVCHSEHGYYLVMEYIEGFPLEDVMNHPGVDAVTRVRLGVRALVDAASGLHSAHRLTSDDGKLLGLVHRDVSPQNILVGVDGSGRIIDFGIARAAERMTLTEPAVLKGKPCYMAPEQIRAEPVDARADVFALGIVLWEVLCGEPLFAVEGAYAATFERVLSHPIPAPSARRPEISKELDDVCLKALARPPAERFASARQFGEALERAANRADVIAGKNEMSDILPQLFDSLLASRRAAITGHGPFFGSPPAPVASDWYKVEAGNADRSNPGTPQQPRGTPQRTAALPANQRDSNVPGSGPYPGQNTPPGYGPNVQTPSGQTPGGQWANIQTPGGQWASGPWANNTTPGGGYAPNAYQPGQTPMGSHGGLPQPQSSRAIWMWLLGIGLLLAVGLAAGAYALFASRKSNLEANDNERPVPNVTRPPTKTKVPTDTETHNKPALQTETTANNTNATNATLDAGSAAATSENIASPTGAEASRNAKNRDERGTRSSRTRKTSTNRTDLDLETNPYN